MQIDALAVEFTAFRLVSRNHKYRQFRDYVHRLTERFFLARVVCAVVVGVERQDAAREHIHKVGARYAHYIVVNEFVGYLSRVLNEFFVEFKILFRRQFSEEEQPRRFLVTESVFSAAGVDYVGNADPSVIEFTVNRHALEFVDEVTVNVADTGKTGNYTGSVGVTKPSFCITLSVKFHIEFAVGIVLLGENFEFFLVNVVLFVIHIGLLDVLFTPYSTTFLQLSQQKIAKK